MMCFSKVSDALNNMPWYEMRQRACFWVNVDQAFRLTDDIGTLEVLIFRAYETTKPKWRETASSISYRNTERLRQALLEEFTESDFAESPFLEGFYQAVNHRGQFDELLEAALEKLQIAP